MVETREEHSQAAQAVIDAWTEKPVYPDPPPTWKEIIAIAIAEAEERGRVKGIEAGLGICSGWLDRYSGIQGRAAIGHVRDELLLLLTPTTLAENQE